MNRPAAIIAFLSLACAASGAGPTTAATRPATNPVVAKLLSEYFEAGERRDAAALKLLDLGPVALPHLLNVAESDPDADAEAVYRLVIRMGEAGVRGMVGRIPEASPDAKCAMVLAMAHAPKERLADVSPAIVLLAGDADDDVRLCATDSLRVVPAELAVQALAQRLADANAGVRQIAADRLGGMDPKAAATVLPLLRAVAENDPSGAVRATARFAVMKLDPPPKRPE